MFYHGEYVLHYGFQLIQIFMGPPSNRYLLNKLYKVTYYLPNSTDDEDVSLLSISCVIDDFLHSASLITLCLSGFPS